jgi:predicted unusual protein kinase regulating ubiquinone biosynthesis (AarF/ABC1/UbiB family)
MSIEKPSLTDEIRDLLLASESDLPTSTLSRLGRTAMAALRGGRLMRRLARSKDGLSADQLSHMIAGIGQLKGVAMKVGQIMSYIDVDLPEELRAGLAALQTHSAPMPFDRVRQILLEDLGDRAEPLLQGMEPLPVAAASIGQVHRASLPDGSRVAVKIRYPDIEAAIAADFQPARFGSLFAALVYPGAKIEGFIEEAKSRFLQECDYLQEAAFQERFFEIFNGHPTIVIPEVRQDFCSRRVLTTFWASGENFQDFLETDPPQSERDRIGEALFEFYIGSLFAHGLYNCDPHPGNYVFLHDGRIAILDHGCTRSFDRAFILKLAKLTHAVHSDDRQRLEGSLIELDIVHEGKRYDFATARALLRSFYGPMLRDEHIPIELGRGATFMEIAKRKRELMKLSLPGEFLFLLRIRFGLMSVLARLGARANWYRLERGYVEQAESESRQCSG